ncbi:uncharacterized protein LOC143286103 [Babylonia areolata]|uniref:uncharacterized protein LOC143286103 n=1 Tax=Babylonia areolata TaxID=304850 RepID=UPI003FD42322
MEHTTSIASWGGGGGQNGSEEEEVVVLGGSDVINPRYPNAIVVALFMVVGLVGNSLVLYVYNAKMETTVFTTFVTFLAGLDLTTTLTAMPLDMVIKAVMVERSQGVEIMCKVAHFEVYTSSMASGAILLLIAATRHAKVCRPTHPQWTTPQARLWCLLIVLVAMALCTVSLVINGMEKVKVSLGHHHQKVKVGPGHHLHHYFPPPPAATNLTLIHDRDDVSLQRTNKSLHPGLPQVLYVGDAAAADNNIKHGDNKLIPNQLQNLMLNVSNVNTTGTAMADDNNNNTTHRKLTPQHLTPNVSNVTATKLEVVEVYICRTSQDQKGRPLFYALYGLLMTAYVTICLSLLLLHTRIACTLLRFNRRQFLRRESEASEADNPLSLNQLTGRMFHIFFAITVTFLLSYLPHLACIVAQRLLFKPGEATPRLARVLLDLAYNAPYVNVVANPFIYGYMSRRFRTHCLRLFSCC